MISAVLVFCSGYISILAIIGAVFLIMPPHTTTAELWQRGEAACEVNSGVAGVRRHYDSLVVECVNGASFTIKIKG
jgi:hypothetical protein